MEETLVEDFSLYIHPADLQELKRDIWEDEGVPGKLKLNNNNKYEVDVSYRGSHIREAKKKSYDLQLYNKRGQFLKTFHVNAEYNDPSLIRNKLSLDFFSKIGVLAPDSNFVSMKVNGRFEGVYLKLEAVDDNFLRKRKLPNGPIFYAVDDDANFSLYSSLHDRLKDRLDSGYERKTGSEQDFVELRELVKQINLLPRQGFCRNINERIDVERYLRWLAGIICTQNFDGFVHNYALYQNGRDRRFDIIPWDYDATWGRDINGRRLEEDFIPLKGYNTLTARVLDDPEGLTLYKKILNEIIENTFTIDTLEPEVRKLYSTLQPHVEKDPYLKDRIKQFNREPDLILEYIKKRRDFIYNHLKIL